jgi:predicted aspartyl protease
MNLYKSKIYKLVALVIFSFSSLIMFGAGSKSRFVSSFNFQLVNGGFIIIDARIQGVNGVLKFMLDSGSSGVSLDSSTASALGLTMNETDRELRGLGDIRKVKLVYDRNLELPSVTLPHLDFHINDYRFFHEAYGVAIDGVIGYPLFKDHIVKVNYATQQIEIWKPGTTRYPAGSHTFYPSINGIPFVDASIKEERQLTGNYLFDTGADICVLFSDKYVSDSSIISAEKKSIDILTAGIGGKQRMKLTTVDHMQVGPFAFNKVPSFIYDDPVNVIRYPQSVGIIGIEFLRRFNIVFNYPAGEINLTPNQNYKQRFHYGYTGFDMYKMNDQVIVDNIVKDSPAEKAGLMANDIVLGVQNTFNNNIEVYRNKVLSAEKTVQLHIMRGNQISNITIEVQSVL